MNRRDFIRRATPVTIVPFVLGGYAVRAFGRSPLLEKLIGTAAETDHVLVLIQLNGGNDGLNMVIPLDEYPSLMQARGNIAIAENKVLKLTDATGLHPAMTGLHSLYKANKLAVVQSVGYPNPNFSHFRATDIWLSGADSNQYLSSGWMGRYLDEEYPDYPLGYPNTVAPDPLAIQIGSVVTTGFQGPNVQMGIAITSSTSFYQLVSGVVDTAPDTRAGHELTFVRHVVQQTQEYTTRIKDAAGKAVNKSTLYPSAGQNSLADQLKIVAQLVAGGLKTRLYIVSIGGFDTHSGQVDGAATELGAHATLLGRLSTAINAFQDDLRLLGVEERVVGMTFSEFGRRIKSNASLGTDHGTAAPVFLFGKYVAAGVIGSNPVIPAAATGNDNIPMQFDFRSIYASILSDWFNVPDQELQNVLLKNFQALPLVGAKNAGDPLVRQFHLYQNYPNPFNGTTRIRIYTGGDHLTVKVYDTAGREVGKLAEGNFSAGQHEFAFDAGNLPSGVYFVHMTNGNLRAVMKMMLVK